MHHRKRIGLIAALGIFSSLLPASAGLAQTGPASAKTGAPTAAPVRVACVGDSITYGSGTSNARTESYPAQLGRMLGADYLVKDFGVGGATLLDDGDKPYRKQRAYQAAQDFKPDIVILLLGTNDSKPQNWKNKSEFVANYESLVLQFASLPNRPKIYVGYPIVVVGPGNYGINEPGVDEAMQMIDRVAAETKATVLDLHKTLIGQPTLIPDRVHPNDVGAGMMAADVYKVLTGRSYDGMLPVPMKSEAPAAPSDPAKL